MQNNKKLVTLIAKDFYNIASVLYDINPEYVSEEMDALRCDVFNLDDRSDEMLEYELQELTLYYKNLLLLA